jgi:hypothetical protein
VNSWLKIKLLSAATFSAGEGISLEVDADVEHDEWGLPFIGARRLKGLLVEECAEILRAFKDDRWEAAAGHLFGTTRAGSADSPGILAIGDARLPEGIQRTVQAAIERDRNPLSRNQVLSAFVEVRRQTEIDHETGAPATTSLRDIRALIRDSEFFAPLLWLREPSDDDLALLTLCAVSMRRGGLKRNRGFGKVSLRCLDETMTDKTVLWLSCMNNIQGGAHG